MNFFELDSKLFFLINHGASNTGFDALMPFLSSKGYLLFLPYFVYAVWKIRRQGSIEPMPLMKQAFVIFFITFFSFLLADWASSEVKRLVERIRPCNVLEGVKLLVGCTKSYSMPSNHASNSFAMAAALFYLTRGYVSKVWSLYPFILAASVGFSRSYVGVHYPADVLAGAALGSIVASALIISYKFTAEKYKIDPHATMLFAGLAAISLFRVYYILHGPLDLSPDEAHYWEWSRRLDLSYYSKGPMIAYLIYASTALFGDTVFGIRIMAVIFSALSSIYMFRLAALMYAGKEDYKGKAVAVSSALLLQAVPMFAPFGVLFTIDSPFVFFWILSLYLLFKAVKSGQYKDWLLLGIASGLGLLTKYTMAFFYACGFLFLFFSEKRGLLKTAKPYLAVAAGILVFIPVIIWNAQHDWVTIKHTAGQAHVAEGIKISLKTFFEFIGSQIGIITPLLFGMMIYAILKLKTRNKELESGFLFWFSMPVIAFFLLKSLQGKVQPNWAMTGYITGIIAFAGYFVGQRAKGKRQKVFIVSAVLLAVLVTAVSHYPSVLKLPLKSDPSSRLRGWKELGTEVSRISDSMRDGNVFIFSDRYQVSSELAFYVKGRPKTYCINLGRRMNQYDLWPGMNAEASKLTGVINAVFVRIDDSDMPPEVEAAFDRCEKKPFRAYDKRNILVREYSIFICYNFKGLRDLRPETY
jgi:undecaprenyl-diphosphatase